MKTIVTHNSSFHTDDIFAVATLMLAYPDEVFEVIRTRDADLINKADIVVDVGQVYDPVKSRFDHHQSGGAGKRPNGIPYASFGLVWKEFGEHITGSATVKDSIDRSLVQPIDAGDNGVNITKLLYEGVGPYTISDFLGSYKKIDEPTEEDLHQTFIELVEIAKALLKREIANEKVSEQLRNEVRSACEQYLGQAILVMDKNIERHIWRSVLVQYPNVIYLVYRDSADGWKAEAVPVSLDSYESRKRFPLSWAGKTKEELAQITGVADVKFSHNSGFMTATKTKEGALAIAELALRS